MPREATEMIVESVIVEAPDAKTIRLGWPAGYDMNFKTGQFITCYWPDDPGHKRAYSLSSCALDRGFYEFTVGRNGKMGTQLVDWIKPGHRLMVLPPAGKLLPVHGPDKHMICIAGGTGVAPFRGFVREATWRKLETRIIILYSVHTPEDIIFKNEFRQLEQENPNFKFHVTCTRVPPEDSWAGRCGRMTPEWVKEHISDLPNTFFYACGPHALVKFAEEVILRDLGIPKERIKTEEWG